MNAKGIPPARRVASTRHAVPVRVPPPCPDLDDPDLGQRTSQQPDGVPPNQCLPPTYVVRGKVIFILGNVCLFTSGGGYPIPIHPCPGGYPIPIHPHPYPSLSGGGTQSNLGWEGGYPDPALDGGVPQPWTGGYPNLGWGVPHLWGGTPSHVWVPPQNSKHLLRLRGGRCASCVHAGGLSCLKINLKGLSLKWFWFFRQISVYLDCVRDAVEEQCGSHAVGYQDKVIRLGLAPFIEFMGCDIEIGMGDNAMWISFYFWNFLFVK